MNFRLQQDVHDLWLRTHSGLQQRSHQILMPRSIALTYAVRNIDRQTKFLLARHGDGPITRTRQGGLVAML